VTLVAKDLIAVTEGLEKTVKGLADLPAGIESELKTTFGDIGTVSKNVWVTKSNEFAQDTQKEYVNYLGKIQQQAEEASAKLKEGGEEFRRVAGNWESLLKEPVDKLIKEAKESIEAELKRLDGALVERYPQVSAKIETFNKSLETMLVQVQSIQAALALWLQEADKAQKQVRVIHEGMVVADLLNNNTEHVKTANQLLTNIQRQMPASGGDGLQTELALMRGLLMDIKNGIATMASRKPQPKPQPPPPEPEKGLWGRLKDKLRGRS
jgi:chromosome segregation ATPase